MISPGRSPKAAAAFLAADAAEEGESEDVAEESFAADAAGEGGADVSGELQHDEKEEEVGEEEDEHNFG